MPNIRIREAMHIANGKMGSTYNYESVYMLFIWNGWSFTLVIWDHHLTYQWLEIHIFFLSMINNNNISLILKSDNNHHDMQSILFCESKSYSNDEDEDKKKQWRMRKEEEKCFCILYMLMHLLDAVVYTMMPRKMNVQTPFLNSSLSVTWTTVLKGDCRLYCGFW